MGLIFALSLVAVIFFAYLTISMFQPHHRSFAPAKLIPVFWLVVSAVIMVSALRSMLNSSPKSSSPPYHTYSYTSNSPSIEMKKEETKSNNSETTKEYHGFVPTWAVDTSTKTFHKSTCDEFKKVDYKYRQHYKYKRDEMIAKGYSPCKKCNP